ncbi:endonuclease G, mitochondrial-like [Panonychus citri]|uniref:endonuclease G, mitochondrial-like n=1 Tax=Panonychus citri TaxID=50023 RepID=UPI002308072A|nr:endonuclease G, mitochondrial-like [Panonychus citri]XP_053203561.1 endonuclease G, mitochondrial-like [Panonychus citri]XP_053203984.1 endonuclease G, mitochondrial-like [Panonychus citri]
MFRKYINTGIAATIGCIGGVLVEKYRNQGDLIVHADASVVNSFKPTDDLLLPSNQIKPIPGENTTSRVSTIMKHGYPSFDSVRTYRNFVLSYDRRLRSANWVFEHLTPNSLEKNNSVSRKNCDFFEDQSIHPTFRARNTDFKSSGYDRGHLAPAGNYRSIQEEGCQTFILSNISPQVGVGFNRGVWNNLEKYVRYRARRSKNLWSVTGPLYLPRVEGGKKYVKYEVIGDRDVAVPTHFFKVLLIENETGEYELESYVIQNKAMDDNIPLKAFQVPIDSIERSAGFILFEKVPKNLLKSINSNNRLLENFQKSSTK